LNLALKVIVQDKLWALDLEFQVNLPPSLRHPITPEVPLKDVAHPEDQKRFASEIESSRSSMRRQFGGKIAGSHANSTQL
jgi:hypothetical protein